MAGCESMISALKEYTYLSSVLSTTNDKPSHFAHRAAVLCNLKRKHLSILGRMADGHNSDIIGVEL